MFACSHLHPYAFHEHYLRGGAKNSLWVLLFFSSVALASQDTLPVPQEPNQLFYLQRDPDSNTVIYQLNTTQGRVNANNPVDVYWIRYAEGGVRKNLNAIQRTMAYGVSHRALGNGAFELRLAAYKDHPLRLAYCQKSKNYKVYTTINSREAVLERIFVRVDGGSILRPNIMYFELIGRDTITQELVNERIKPNQ